MCFLTLKTQLVPNCGGKGREPGEKNNQKQMLHLAGHGEHGSPIREYVLYEQPLRTTPSKPSLPDLANLQLTISLHPPHTISTHTWPPRHLNIPHISYTRLTLAQHPVNSPAQICGLSLIAGMLNVLSFPLLLFFIFIFYDSVCFLKTL